MNCHCNSGKEYRNCCEPIILGTKAAQTAEELMRSRYCAFVIANVNYLMISHHASSRPIRERKNILQWTKSVQWVGLQIIGKKEGEITDQQGWVEFKATYIEDGHLGCIHEKSFFIKEKDTWYYKSGDHR